MTAGYTGGLSVKMGDGASPQVYSLIEEIKGFSGLGQTNPLVDMTSHDSTAREYIAGLADGDEITIECNKVNTAGNKQAALRTNVKNKATAAFQVTSVDTSVSPNLTEVFTFDAVCLHWDMAPSFDDANIANFTLKITGDVTIS